MLEYLRQKLEFAYADSSIPGIESLKDLSRGNHLPYLVAISIINVQCEKDIKPQNFLKKLKINLQWCQIMSFAM